MLNLNNDPAWLMNKAQEEEGASFSTGGLYAALTKSTPWFLEAAEAEALTVISLGRPAPLRQAAPSVINDIKIAKLILTLEMSPAVQWAKAGLALTSLVDRLSHLDRSLGGSGLQMANQQDEPRDSQFSLSLQPVYPADYAKDQPRLARIAEQVNTIQADHSAITAIQAQVA